MNNLLNSSLSSSLNKDQPENDTSPTITIIIPAYNVADYIDETLTSIAKQSMLPDEIIIINDGSSDNTADKIKAHPLSRFIQLIETENKGQGHARNLGIAKASSEYIYFFDADDLLITDYIESIKKLITANQHPGVIFFSGRSFKDANETGSNHFLDYIRPFKGSYGSQANFIKALKGFEDLSCHPCLYISKRSLWTDNQLQFNDFFHEDEEVFLPLIFSASSYIVSKEVFFLRRLRNNSTMTQSKSIKHELGQKALLQSLLSLITKHKSNPLQTRFIRRRLSLFCVDYLATVAQVSGKLNYILLLTSIFQSRNINSVFRIVKYAIKKRL